MYFIGNARRDENGQYHGGRAGDQDQKEAPDFYGEVAMQPFYLHSKGWDVLRAKDVATRKRLAIAMIDACSNPNIGYDQDDRYNIMRDTIYSATPTDCDCSSLVRACIYAATGKDVGDFYTGNERGALINTKLFDYVGEYYDGLRLLQGDIIVTRSKGHTAIIVSDDNGILPFVTDYYPAAGEGMESIVDALESIGVDSSKAHRANIAEINNIEDYTGTYAQNVYMLKLLREGRLLRD